MLGNQTNESLKYSLSGNSRYGGWASNGEHGDLYGMSVYSTLHPG